MAQIFAALFFSLAAITAFAGIALTLRGEWTRIVAILSGRELAGVQALAPRFRVRMRAWKGPEHCQPVSWRAAA